jgi:putative ABC transport system ATP-binding protein
MAPVDVETTLTETPLTTASSPAQSTASQPVSQIESPIKLVASQTPVAELIQVCKYYGEGETRVKALDGLSLRVYRGEYVAVMGASGSGKSTAMSILGCLDRPSSGSYRLNGRAIESLSDDQLALMRNRDLGFVFQQFHLLPQLSALENVMLPMVYAGVPLVERRRRATVALERVGLAQRLANKPNQLSGGQQQRVAIARAIINNPALLLADEPTGALDSRTTSEVLAIFDQLHQSGITLVLVTHELEVASRAERLVQFKDGQLLADRRRSPEATGGDWQLD